MQLTIFLCLSCLMTLKTLEGHPLRVGPKADPTRGSEHWTLDPQNEGMRVTL